MVVHKKVVKAVKKVGKKVVKKVLKFMGAHTRKPTARSSRSRSPRIGSRSFPSGVRIRMGVTPTPSDRGPRSRTRVKKLQTTKPKRQVGPPKVGMRTVKGRRGKLITIKRPRPRNA